jgi:hypothetical protein
MNLQKNPKKILKQTPKTEPQKHMQISSWKVESVAIVPYW